MPEKVKSDIFYKGYLMARVYYRHVNGKIYSDIVYFRKVRGEEGSKWVRGANLKPSDLLDLIDLTSTVMTHLAQRKDPHD